MKGGTGDTLFIDLFMYLFHTDTVPEPACPPPCHLYPSLDVLHLRLVILPLTVRRQHLLFNLCQTALNSLGHFRQFGFEFFGLQAHFSEQLARHGPQWHSRSHHLFTMTCVCACMRALARSLARTHTTPVSWPSRLQPVWVCVLLWVLLAMRLCQLMGYCLM